MFINRKEDADGFAITGGRIIHPNVLPPSRGARIQGGRFIHPGYLPPPEIYNLQGQPEEGIGIDWDVYHFGSLV